MFVQVSTDNRIKTDAEANARLEERIRSRLKRFGDRLTHVELHVTDLNGEKGGDGDKCARLEARPAGHDPVAVHAEAHRVDTAVTQAIGKVAKALDHALGRQREKRGH